jgi:hypothetical protein
MSKQIDFSQPLSDEDAAWAEQFHGLHAGMLAANREQFPQKPAETLEGADAEEPPYAEWSKADLLSETKRRNEEEGTTLKTTGTVAELAQQLENDDKERTE